MTELTLSQRTLQLPRLYPKGFLFMAAVAWWLLVQSLAPISEALVALLPVDRASHLGGALHLSVAAGIRSDSIAAWLGTERIVRSMPTTPALVGKGMTALFARSGVLAGDVSTVERVIATTGEFLWVGSEALLDGVTALSGSGPAYVFFFLEAMIAAGQQMGLSAAQAHKLAVGTFVGASELARASDDPPEVLRERVTSKGGTTYAAITSMQEAGLQEAFIKALHAAQQRAVALGDEFGS